MALVEKYIAGTYIYVYQFSEGILKTCGEKPTSKASIAKLGP